MLFLTNGGSAIALLAFLQTIWGPVTIAAAHQEVGFIWNPRFQDRAHELPLLAEGVEEVGADRFCATIVLVG